MLAIARAMAALCVSIGPLPTRRSDTLEKFSASDAGVGAMPPSRVDGFRRIPSGLREHRMIESLQAAFADNQLVSGGVLLALLGIVAMWFRELPVKLAQWGKHFFVTTLTADSRDELMFPALIEYMDSRDALRRLNNFTVRSVRQGTAYQSLNDELQQGGRPATVFSPGEGFHLFFLDGRLMWMKREVQVATSIIEKIALSTFGRQAAAGEPGQSGDAAAHRARAQPHRDLRAQPVQQRVDAGAAGQQPQARLGGAEGGAEGGDPRRPQPFLRFARALRDAGDTVAARLPAIRAAGHRRPRW
ncbi:MAG: hypothetical protein IPI27_13665 [Betaproteobacteria bacterium]|nr:hypothetical protein [Betaproteobacteria bacterium]